MLFGRNIGRQLTLMCMILIGTSAVSSAATVSEMDVLLSSLVRKGVLTAKEASNIRLETRKLVEAQGRAFIHKAKKEIKVPEASKTKSDVSKWVKKMKFGGDLRVRFQGEDKGDRDRERTRLRLRLKSTATINDQLSVGMRLATGGDDPRSTNQTFQNMFSPKSIKLDRAFVEYKPIKNVAIYAGKFGKTFFKSSGMLWDDDLNFEGAAVQYKTKFDNGVKVGINSGYYILDDHTDDDSIMLMFQPTAKWKINDKITWKLGIGYLTFKNLKGQNLKSLATDSDIGGGNTLNLAGDLAYDYDAFILSSEVVLKIEAMPRIAIVKEYVKASDSGDIAFAFGFKVGDKKVKKKGQWQASYEYRKIEADAFFAGFPDSDFFGGDTGVKGYKLAFKYGMVDNATLGMTYYKTEEIDGNTEEDLFQADLVLGF